MTAATGAQSIDKKGLEPIQRLIETGMKANTQAFFGTLAVIDAGYLAPGRTATGLIAVGFFEPGGMGASLDGYDNRTATTGGAAGAINGRAVPGCRKLQNSGTDPVAQADVGNDCFIVDDSTIAKTDGGGTRSRGGKIVQVDTDGVFVEVVNTGTAIATVIGSTLNNLGYHQPVRCVFPTNFAGAVVAGVLTATANGALATQDGVAPAVGDRVLVAAQTTAADNGIYTVTSLGGASAKAVLTRASDAATGAAITPGERVSVAEGTLFAGTEWVARVTGSGKLVATDDPKFYPSAFKKTITLAAGTYTIGAGGGGEPCFLFSTTLSSVSIARNTANTSTATTGGYAAPVASRIAGVGGTGAVLVQAQVAAGTISNADISTLDVLITN
jgi:hypothetical protein